MSASSLYYSVDDMSETALVSRQRYALTAWVHFESVHEIVDFGPA